MQKTPTAAVADSTQTPQCARDPCGTALTSHSKKMAVLQAYIEEEAERRAEAVIVARVNEEVAKRMANLERMCGVVYGVCGVWCGGVFVIVISHTTSCHGAQSVSTSASSRSSASSSPNCSLMLVCLGVCPYAHLESCSTRVEAMLSPPPLSHGGRG